MQMSNIYQHINNCIVFVPKWVVIQYRLYYCTFTGKILFCAYINSKILIFKQSNYNIFGHLPSKMADKEIFNFPYNFKINVQYCISSVHVHIKFKNIFILKINISKSNMAVKILALHLSGDYKQKIVLYQW